MNSPGAPGASAMMRHLAAVIDARRWDELPGLLHPGFSCHYLHTGETFDADTWVRLNAEYPGFDHLRLEECVAEGDRAAGRAHVTGYAGGQLQHFEVATFLTVEDGLIARMTELWADVGQEPSAGTRPGPA